ncbi:1113_t:CDS:2, partial [Gigaspora margarita]
MRMLKTLDGKMKQLKKIGKVARHHDPLTNTEIQAIFAHEATSISHPQGLQYRIFMWCCLLFAPRGGIDGIPVPPDPEGLL